MKKIAKITVIILLVFLMFPLAVFAAPKGYKEVKLTKKSFKNYFTVEKMKTYDSSGNYAGYGFELKSKLLKKKYYLYSFDGFSFKYTFKDKYKYKYKKRTQKGINKVKGISSELGMASNFHWCLNANGFKYDYKYAKVKSFKVSDVKGKLVFIEPSNVKGIKRIYDQNGKCDHSIIVLKYPYDKNTTCEGHWENDKFVVDYYYMQLYSKNVYYNGKGGIKGETIVR